MKRLFLLFVNALSNIAEISAATLYSSGTSCNIAFEYEGDVYELMLLKTEKKEEETDGNSND